MWHAIQSFGFTGLLQVLVLWAAFYYFFLFFRGTRGVQVLVGLLLLLGALLVLTELFNLDALAWLLRRFTVYLAVALIIIFQPEIRRALAELGKQPIFSPSADERSVIDHVVQAVAQLAERKIGALIAIQRDIGMKEIEEKGIRMEARVVPELLASIFYPHTPLHDGGVIIRGHMIVAAGCEFPLSQQVEAYQHLGTRHMAALGLSEETDAVVAVVSEETGAISVAYRGRLTGGLTADRLKRFLSDVLLQDGVAKSVWKRAQEQLDLTREGIAKSERLAQRKEDRRG